MAKISDYSSLGVGVAPADDDLFHVPLEDVNSHKITYDALKTYAASYKNINVLSSNISAAAISTLYSSPVIILPNPGLSGYANVLISVIVYYNYGTAAYTDRQIGIYQDSSRTYVATEKSTFENSGNDSYVILPVYYDYSIDSSTDYYLSCETGDPGGVGDGTMKIKTVYQEIRL